MVRIVLVSWRYMEHLLVISQLTHLERYVRRGFQDMSEMLVTS